MKKVLKSTLMRTNINSYSRIINQLSSKSFSFLNYVEKNMVQVHNKKGTRIPFYSPIKPDINMTREEMLEHTERNLNNIMDGIHKAKKFYYHPYFTHKKRARRLLEVPQPSYLDRYRKKERRRQIDRAVVRHFCRKVLYLYQKYIPQIGRTIR